MMRKWRKPIHIYIYIYIHPQQHLGPDLLRYKQSIRWPRTGIGVISFFVLDLPGGWFSILTAGAEGEGVVETA